MKKRTYLPLLALLAFGCLANLESLRAALPEFDFTQPAVGHQWHAQHHIALLKPTADGLAIDINGPDPYFVGPVREFPTNESLWMVLRLKAQRAGDGQVFYFRPGTNPTEEMSVHFGVRSGNEWEEIRVPLPPLGPAMHLRIDPPGDRGQVLLARVWFEKRVTLPPPQWPAWIAPAARPETVLRTGDVEVRPGAVNPDGFEIRVAGQSMAFAHPRQRLAYVLDDAVRWVDLPPATVGERPEDGAWLLRMRVADPDGAVWQIERRLAADSPGAVRVETTVRVDQDRTVAFLPLPLLIAGEQSFGSRKNQGLLAGLEYLGDEPSSSEADIEGPESKRQVPAPHKLTFPLMAIQANDRYVGMIWEPAENLSAVFDSPDRFFGSGGHAMGLIFPGANTRQRAEGNLMPYFGTLLSAEKPLRACAWIIGGRGATVIPAVQQYVRMRGLPSQPSAGVNFQEYVSLAASGWLDSRCRDGNLYRHAYWPGFNPTPAADAAMFELWLAAQTTNAPLAARLRQAAGEALAVVKPEMLFQAGVGHIRTPAPALIFGTIEPSIIAARRQALQLLGRFEPDGTIPYRRTPGHPDYGQKHFAPDANGLTAQVVATLLDAAVFSGDTNLMAQGVLKLRALDKFSRTVPRGAQTWEVPLHTPDILASAHLINAYLLGFEITGEQHFLEEAIYWAWTGVPFIYLINPTGQKVGAFSTIAVLGATSWKAPVWFGRPVQWCGLVYADALYRLAKHDSASPWREIANGITATGLQHSWGNQDPERVGLLPDYFELLIQQSAGPAINPATVGINAVRLFERGTFLDRHTFQRTGWMVQAPSEIQILVDEPERVVFATDGWAAGWCWVLVNGFHERPTVRIDGESRSPGDSLFYHEKGGRLAVKIAGRSEVEIRR